MLAMKIRSGRDQQPVTSRQLAIPGFRAFVVIRVRGLEGVEAARGQTRDAIILRTDTGMRDGCETARRMKQCDDGLGRSAAARHVRRAVEFEIALERFIAGANVAGRYERVGDLRAAYAAAAGGRLDDRPGVNRRSKAREPIAHLLHTPYAVGPLSREKRFQLGSIDVDEVSKHVDVAPGIDRTDFDARHEIDPCVVCGRTGLPDTRNGIVVGDADSGKARRASGANEVRRRQCAVGRGGVKMEIDHAER